MAYWKWRILLATMVCYLFYYCGRLNLSVCMKPIMEEFGWNKTQMGFLVATLTTAYGAGQFINGNLTDRFGRVMMPLGAVVSCGANWAFSLAPEIGGWVQSAFGIATVTTAVFTTMCAFWAVNGYFQAMGMAPGGRLISNWWAGRERGRAMGLFTFAAALSNVTVYLVATWSADSLGWRAAFRYPVLLMALVAVVFYFLTRDHPSQVGLDSPHPPDVEGTQASNGWQRYAVALGNPSFLLAGVSIALHHVVRWGLLSFMVVFFMETRGWKIKNAGLVSTALPLGMAIGAASGGWISDRVFGGRRAKIISISLVMCAICVILIPSFAVTYLSAVCTLAVAGYMLYLCIGPYFALPADLLGYRSAGTGIGILNACAYSGAALGTVTIGWLSQEYGYPAGFGFMAACSVLGAIVIQFVREPTIEN